MDKQTTQCIENIAVRESYRATVQSAEISSIRNIQGTQYPDRPLYTTIHLNSY